MSHYWKNMNEMIKNSTHFFNQNAQSVTWLNTISDYIRKHYYNIDEHFITVNNEESFC